MRVVRGREASPTADRDLTNDLREDVIKDGQSTLRVWRPHRTVVFGRRDTAHPGYEKARSIASNHGFDPVERSVGGHAVAFTGTTVAFALIQPIGNERAGIQERYERAERDLQDALEVLGVSARLTEPPNSFCPGCHSLSADGKLAGLAQRVKREVAIISGVVNVGDHEAIADVLAPVYDALEVEFDPETVGSVARAGGPSDPEEVCLAIQRSFTDGTPDRVRDV